MASISDRPKVLIAGGVLAGAAIVLIKRTISKGSRNKLDVKLPVPEDIVIAQSVQLTPVRSAFCSCSLCIHFLLLVVFSGARALRLRLWPRRR